MPDDRCLRVNSEFADGHSKYNAFQMVLFNFDPDDPPLPRGQVRIREVRASPYPDGRRIRLAIRLTPFQERPNLQIEVFNASGTAVASLTLIESLQSKLELTVHLREPHPQGAYRAVTAVHYAGETPLDIVETAFEVTSQPEVTANPPPLLKP